MMDKTAVYCLLFLAIIKLIASQSTGACSPNPCQNGANCAEARLAPFYVCFCVGSWMGQDCDFPDIYSSSSTVQCNQNFYLDRSGNITSPGWPNFYAVREFCLYSIKIPSALSIRLEIVFFETERYKDELHIIAGPLFPGFNDPRIRALNGTVQDGTKNVSPLLFDINQVTMLWESDFNINKTGFLLSYSADIDNCWRNQCDPRSICVDLEDDTGYRCICPDDQAGRFCESGVVIIAETRPTASFPEGSLVEGISSINIFFDLALTPSQLASFRVTGSNLWHVTASLSSQNSRNGDFVSVVPLLSFTQGSRLWNPPSVTTLNSVEVVFPIGGFVCSDTQFLCATINKSTTADFVIRGEPTDESLTGCTQITCRGVEISATTILGLDPINIQDGQNVLFQFDIALDSVAGAGSVRGEMLWLVNAFASSASDGSVRVGREQRILLAAGVSNTSVIAGSRSILEDLSVVLDFQNLNCAQLRYFCVEVMRNPQGTEFTLTGVPTDDVLVTCQEIDCGAVQIIQTSYASNNPTTLLGNSASNIINLDLTALSLRGSNTISGTDLWQVEIFTNQQIDGLGLTAVSQSATLSVSAANAALNAGGGSIVLSNVEANIDLTGITCSQVTYICTRLQRNPQSQPEFILEGIPGDRVFTYCQGFSCTDRRNCDDVFCQNGGTCVELNNNPSCTCAPGWMGPLCADPVNACTSGVCLFGGTCVNNQFNFVCLCTLGRAGPICELEDAGVNVLSVSPVIQSGFVREGFFLNALNLDVAVRTDGNGDSVSGTGLWALEFFLSDRDDGSGARYDFLTSGLNSIQASTAIAAGSTESITGVFSTVDLRTLTCPQVPYICAELSKGNNPNPDFLLTGSLVGCTAIDCRGVVIVDSQLQFSSPPVLVERSSVNSLTFDFLLTSDTTGGSVMGDDLWNLVWYLSTEPDDTGMTQVIPVSLTSQQSGLDLVAGTPGTVRSVNAQISTLPLTCSEFGYICVRLEKNPSASIDFTLSASNDQALSDCQQVTCRGVEVTNLRPSYSPEQIRSGQNNFLMFNLDVFTNSGGASVSGTDLWMVEVFTNTNSNGDGTSLASTIATIPTGSLNQGINAGITSTLNSIQANLDLTSATCSDIPFVCVRLSRNQFSNPDFTLVDSNGDEDIVQCQQYPCEDPSPCENNFCQNGATCVVQNDGFTCICTNAFVGQFCGTVNPCFQTNACNGNGLCTPLGLPGLLVCTCTNGFTGVNCQVPPDPCNSSPCFNAGTCVRLGSTLQFSCSCPPFFEGEFCQLEDPCRGNPCGADAQCLGNTQDGTFQCFCLGGSKGDSCQFPEPCFSSPCLNQGVCASTSTGSQYTCTCQQGFQGVNCQLLDPCVSNPCGNGGTCVSAADGSRFDCVCPPFIFGNICQFSDPCSSNPCQNNGFCSRDPQGSRYTCTCNGNFLGVNCQFANPCFPEPCLNNGDCTLVNDGASFTCDCPNNFLGDSCQNLDPCLSSPCQNGATCRTTLDGSAFICDCTSGFFGLTCAASSICATVPCRNGGTCTPNALGTQFTCTCPTGFLLPQCRIRDGCSFNPCQNQGTCVSNTDGSYFCLCRANFFGVNCANPDPCQSNPCLGGGTCNSQSQGLFYTCDCPPDTFGLNCENRDPCSSNPCINGGTCHTSGELSTFMCACRVGYVGLNCEILAPCDVNPCRFGGTCVSDSSQVTGYRCLCILGRTGTTCNEVDLCASLSPCLNGATCVPNTNDGTYSCQCPAGYTDQQCQTEIPCFNNPCLNGGTCITSGTTYTCLCISPFEGINCQFASLTTPTPTQCLNANDFPCFTGGCISSLQRCDQVINCGDGFSDEIGCPIPCRSEQFSCQDGSSCVSNFLICDGTAHCQDGSDESLPQCFPCASNPCRNNGLCLVAADQRSYSCNCLEGFTGPTCEGVIVATNDPPEFTSSSDIFISEGTLPNELVFTLQARDVNGDDLQFDLRGNAAITYFFMQDMTSGEIYLRRDLDREIIGDTFEFTVVVRDARGAEVEQVITVFLDDVNDNDPVITNLPARIRLPEDNPREEVFQVTATDLDLGLGSVLSYSIESVDLTPDGLNPGNLFAINGATGSIFLTHTLDFETTQQYVLNIRVSDLGTPSLVAFGTLTIDIDDVQDLGPLFINLPYDMTITETQTMGSVVQTVTAVDQDITTPTPVRYSFVIGNEQGYFNLNPSTGVLTLARPLDRDDLLTPASFTLTVRAEEVGSPTNFDFNTFTITVLDVQDEPPSFNQNFYEATIQEDEQIGGVLPLNIFISDNDRATEDVISLEIEGPDDLPFTVTPGTIQNEGSVLISVSGPLDYEATQTYQFMLIAKETNPLTNENLTATSTITVNLQDVNDNDPIFDQASFSGSVTEGATIGTFITSVSATDRDSNQNAQISFSIVQGNEQILLQAGTRDEASLAYQSCKLPKELFRIDSTSGDITTQSPTIDFETSQMRYRLVVEATNPTPPIAPATGSSLIDVVIDILDTNDNSPIFTLTKYNASVNEIAEPGFTIIRVSATDIDSGAGGEVRYSINGGNADGHFAIDEVTGDITLRTVVDREIRDFYSLTIVATDQADPFNIGLSTVDINVRDFNDNDPIWRQTNYNADLSEGSQMNSFVVRVQADDIDIGPNSMLIYSLSPNNPSFEINPNTGEISLIGQLDREIMDEIILTVVVTDNGNPNRPASSPATVTIRVTDVNDNPPMFVEDPYRFVVEENQQANLPVGQVFATDVDQVGTHIFSFFSEVPGFAIDPSTGEISTTQAFDREIQSFYQFEVVVFDGVFMDITTVNVSISDVNDADPIFDLSEYSASLPEDFPLLTEILTVAATDIDQVESGDITFRFESQRNVEGPFTLDLNTGLLEITSPLDHELESMYTLSVIAVDTTVGGIQRTGTTLILINVTDVNDNGPQFTLNPYPEESVAENIREGVAIVQVFTTDEDTEVNSGVMYRIVQGNIGGVFTVDAEGVISRGPTPLDRETLDFYLLVVEAFDPSDPSLPTDSAVVTIQITDVNDVVPEFVQSIYSRLDLTEDVEIGTRVINVQARDMDLLAAGMVRYSIIAGDDQGFFDIDATTGEIRTSSEFPSISETMTFNLTVQARDQSAPFNVGTAYVVVNILDAGEIPPVFVLPRYEADSIENLGPGTFVVQVQALVENRPANLRYSLDPNAHPDVMMHFIVNETTGEIIIRSPLDREDNDFFAFTVFAEGETISSSTAVWVTVLDANDNAPTFIEFPEDVTIMEGSPAQTVIGEIRTSDLDINQNAQINYRISDGNREGAFTLRTTSDGVSLITTRPLNREFTDEYNITIIAFDSGEPVLESSQTVRISVGDINDNAPLFTTSSYSGDIFENVLSSSPVATLTVTDSDLTATNNLIFTIIQGNEEGKFTVNNRGEVTLTSSLDRETVDSYQLTVRLQDPSYDDQYQVFVPVYVTVLDQNDNSPIFAQDSYEAQVGEGLRSVIVTTVSASDRDLGVNREIRFNVTGSNSEFFTIDPIQGHLLTDTELDREALDAYIVVITATDQAADPMERLTSTTTVTVSVTDINDSPPAFTSQQYGPYSILEESTNAFIDTIQATDPDLGSGGMVTFSLIGEFRDYFRLNPSTGLLTVNTNRPLDYEEQQQIKITIVARDAEGLQSTRDVTINVININDNNPRFEGAPYTFTISENVTIGTLAFIAVATDADLGPPGVVTYSIVDGNTNNVFWINPDNGEIYINKTLDRETIASYDLVIEANDNPVNPDDTRTTTTSLTITVSDADDVPPTFPSDRYLGTILENTFIGTLVSMDQPIIAVDSDEVSVIMYVIRGNESASFMIDPLSGELRSSEVFDREVKALYTFTVIATDSQGSYAEAEVVVTVLDANDNEPVLDLSEYNYTIPEGSVPGSLVGQLTATDGDGHAVRFSIITGAEDKFIIDPETGWISVATRAVLDREQTPSYTLTVSVTDQGSPQMTTTGTVVIDLSDINDSPPTFTETETTVRVSESEVTRTINVFIANDPDLNAMVRYLINSVIVLDQNGRDITSEIDSSGWFSIDEVTGELTLIEQIDREAVSEINVVISAIDENGVDPETRTSNPDAEVQIIITDTNDNAPAIQPIRVTVLQEQSSEGTIITTVVANDPDQGDGGMVTYSILNQVDLPVSIDPNTGVITISEVIDREDISWVNFTVVVSDAGDPALTSTVDVNLRVTDINDNNPSFNQTIYVSMVNESSSVGECFTFIVASDADAGDFGAVTYTLSGGDGLFEISSETGEVCLLGRLDREIVNQYTLIITAKDNPAGSSNNRRETSTTLIVDVTDTNEFAPTANPEFPFTLPEGEPPGTVVGEITAIDPDSPDTPLIYIISDIQPPGAEGIFTIDSETGEIILIGEIDSDNASFSDEYRINIIISDGGNPERTTMVVSVITIIDLNDTPPSFGQGYYNVSVSEDFDTKNPVITLSATDPDENTALTYRITRGNEDSSFLISSDTGEIRLLGTFDHETRQLYELTVSVTDQGGLESTAVVDIHVTDVNDNEPRFTESLYQFSVCENEPTGFEIGRIQALDNDLSLSNNDIIYTILTGNEDGSLMLDPATGIITSTRPYDSEVEEGFTLTVEARNHRIQDGPITDTSVVSILIVDKNDNDPQFGRTDYSQNIRETETGTVDAIFATDIDSGVNGIVSYRIIEGNSLGLFSIGETNGLLTLIRPISSLRDPVFEFQLVVEAFDMGNPSRSSNQTVVITVGDDNDRAPIFLVPRPGEVFELPENEPPGYFLVCLNATDRDLGNNGEIVYEFFTSETGNGDYRLFTLNRTTGKLFANFTADREAQSTYTLVVLASDQGQPPRRTPLQIIIEVTDKADTDPEFPTDPDGTPVKQNLPPVPEGIATPTVLANVTRAVDLDLNSTIYYFIVSGNDDGLFEVNPTTGEIIVVGTLDFENQPTHTIVVKATNDVNFVPSGGPYDVSTDRTLKEVFISVTDINDNPHMFLDQLIVTGVPRDAPVDSAVITVSVNDPDTNSVGNIMYRITRAVFISNQGGDPRTASGIFYIDEDTGTIRTNTRFVESDLDGFFQLDIEAVDKETGLEVGTVVQIHVLESDQRVVLVIEDSVTNVRLKIDILRELLSNLTGGIVRIDDITAVVDENGNRIGQTMVFFHVVDRETNQIEDSGTVVRIIDENADSIQRLFIGNGVVDVYPVSSGAAAGGIGWLGALLLALALLLFLGALLFIILLCCLPRWYNKFLGGGAAGAAGAARGQQLVITEKDSYDGRHNQGFDDTDFKKEYEYQEGIVNFDGEDMYVDQAHDALIMTSLVGKNSRRDNFAYGDGSSLNENGLIGEGGFHDNYFSEERTNVKRVGTINRDGSVSVVTGESDGMFGGTFPRTQETSFIETSAYSQSQRNANTLSHKTQQPAREYSRMVTNEIDREALRKQTAAEIRAMLDNRTSEESKAQFSRSTARFDNMNRSVSVNVGYDDEQDYNRSHASSRQGSSHYGGEVEAVVDVGYDHDRMSSTGFNHVDTYGGSKQYLDPMSDFGNQSNFHEERTKREFQEDDGMMVSEERHVTQSSSHKVYMDEPKPKQREVVDELFIINGEEPFPVEGRGSVRSGTYSSRFREGDGHSLTSRTLSTHSDDDLRRYNVGTMSTARGSGWSSLTDFDNIDEGNEDIIEERRTVKKRTRQMAYVPEGRFYESDHGF